MSTPSDDISTGRLLTAEEDAEFDALRAELTPAAASERVETFAKGLFAVAATVGALGAGFNVAGPDLEEQGQKLLAVAVLLAGFSLALALVAQIPLGVRYNPNSPTNMRRELERSLRMRLGVVLASGVTLAAALLLAAVSPLVSTTRKGGGPTLLSHRLTASGELTVTAEITGARPFSAASLVLLRIPPPPRSVHVSTKVRASARGRAGPIAKTSAGPNLRAIVATARWRDAHGRLHTSRVRIPVR